MVVKGMAFGQKQAPAHYKFMAVNKCPVESVLFFPKFCFFSILIHWNSVFTQILPLKSVINVNE